MKECIEAMGGLLSNICGSGTGTETLAEGAMLLRGFVTAEAASIIETVWQIAEVAPFRHMITPGGYRMSVAMTNCGRVGWTADRSGYRYEPIDSKSGRPWPPMPMMFRQLAERAAARAGFSGFDPDSCLISRYEPGAKLSLHQDRNEESYDAPIVSFSLGLHAKFLFGGLLRTTRPRRFRLQSGDVVVWGGPARLAYHGVDPLADGDHPLTGRCRLNLTFRRALA
jgi:alkylated DNA repair protein (DNA oxidative demethylase)